MRLGTVERITSRAEAGSEPLGLAVKALPVPHERTRFRVQARQSDAQLDDRRSLGLQNVAPGSLHLGVLGHAGGDGGCFSLGAVQVCQRGVSAGASARDRAQQTGGLGRECLPPRAG
jgi:hypothetical protein